MSQRQATISGTLCKIVSVSMTPCGCTRELASGELICQSPPMLGSQRGVSVVLILAVCIASGSGQGLQQHKVPTFPALPRRIGNAASLQALAPSSADTAGMAPSYVDVQV